MKPAPVTLPPLDRYAYYEAAVQNPAETVRQVRRLFHGRGAPAPRRLREDFCATASIACEWVRQRRDHEAWGRDLDPAPLAWARRYNLPRLGSAAARVHLDQCDVRAIRAPRVEAICAMNFSYCIFHDRATLGAYFRAARRGLEPGGLLLLDAFGGMEAMSATAETRAIPRRTLFCGLTVPAFSYHWEHAHFNVVDHHILCRMHFVPRRAAPLRNAFTYDWRLWTLPELTELLTEAGFEDPGCYLHGWTPDGESNERYVRRRRYENTAGWLAYVAAWNPRPS